jgi:hypothetical protein
MSDLPLADTVEGWAARGVYIGNISGSDMPHLVAGAKLSDRATEELVRIVEAYLREHDMPVAVQQLHTEPCNKAIDWWNGLQPEEREEPTS